MGLSYQEHGDQEAPMIVFLHGGGVSSWMWDKQIQYFNHYHCITIDLPEQGASRHTEPFSIESSAAQINELITSIANGKSVTIIGFSLGAQVAVQMLSLDSNIANHAMINSALVRPHSLMKTMIGPSIKLFFPLIKNKAFSKLQAKTLYIGEAYFETYYKESTQMKSDTLIRILEENMSFKIPEGFKNTTAKILVTVGQKEKSIMKKSARDLVSAHPHSRGIIIPKVGHGISLLNPVFFNKMLENWIQTGTLPDDVVEI